MPSMEAEVRTGMFGRGMANPHVRRGLWSAAGSLALLTMVRIVYPAPPEVLFNGAVLGSLSGLVAMGIVLVYRSNRIINFAAGDLGGVAGVLMATLITGPQWAFPFALAAGIIAGTATGGVLELTVVRRFSSAPRLILTVVTILIASLLAAVQLIIPTLFDLSYAPQSFPVPLDFFQFRWGVLAFRGSHLLVLVAVPLIATALGYFFRRTRLGIAVRASAESSDRALLLGIPVRRINTAVWLLAAALSSTSAVLRSFIVGAPLGAVLGLTLLSRAIAAAVIARMEHLWVAFGAAVVIGIVEEAVFFSSQRSTTIEPVLFVIVLVALIAQSRGTVSRAVDKAQASWTALRDVRPVPPELAGIAAVKRVFWAARVPVLAVLIVGPAFLGTGRVFLMSYGVIYAIIALSLVVLTGWTGQISLGQLGFAGVGAAVVAAMHTGGWDPLLALGVGALAGALTAVVVGIPALRIQGLFLAVATFMFTIACQAYFLNPGEFSWVPASRLPERPILFGRFDLEMEHAFYWFCLALLGVVLFVMRSMRASRAGRVFIALRDNERGVQAYGVNVMRAKLVAFATSGFIAALGGGLLALHQHGRMTALLGPEENLRLFLVAVVGGLGSPTGVLLSVALFQFVDYFVPSLQVRLIFNAIGVLAILLLRPSGLGGVAYDVRDGILRRIAKRRDIHVPSLVADSQLADQVDEHLLVGAGGACDRMTVPT